MRVICINPKRPVITYHQGRCSVGLTWSHANIVILGRPSKWTPIKQLLFVAQWTSVCLPKSNVGVQLLDLWLTNPGISTWRSHCTYTSLLQLIMRLLTWIPTWNTRKYDNYDRHYSQIHQLSCHCEIKCSRNTKMNMCGHHSQGKNHLQVLVFSHLAAY